MAEAELHRERLQAIAEKRKRQAEIEDKRQVLEDQVLQLQHLKSKLLREKWLMQGTAAPSAEEEEARRLQLEEEEHKVKRLEDSIHRLADDIKKLESEESQISAKEQIIREKLREAETSFEDLQKNFSKQDGDAVNYIYSQIPDFPGFYPRRTEASPARDRTYRAPGMKEKRVQFEDQNNSFSSQRMEDERMAAKPPKIPDDDNIKLKRDRDQNSAKLLDSTAVVSVNKNTMEFEIPALEHKAITLVTSADQIDSQTNFYSPVANHNGLHYQQEPMDSDVAKEIQFLDEVLEANCCDSTENTFNGTYSPEPSATVVGGAAHSVTVENDHTLNQKEILMLDRKLPPVVEQCSLSVLAEQHKTNGHSPCEQREDNHCDTSSYPGSPSSSNSSRRSSKDGEINLTTIKKEAKFELRALHEDKKPAKLFDDIDEKDRIRVRKVRPTEEVVELEKERRELIRSQAVKKNPGIAAKWWNPPQEKTLEEQLDEEHLESHKKYKERKQRQQGSFTAPKPKTVSFVPPDPVPVMKEDIVTEQIDFSAARKQFLNMEHANQARNQAPSRRSATPKLFTVKPFYKSLSPTPPKKATVSVTGPSPAIETTQIVQAKEEEVTSAKAANMFYTPEEHLDNRNSFEEPLLQEPAFNGSPKDELPAHAWQGESDFLRATAVLTEVKDEDPDMADNLFMSASISSPPDESDSGLDELSVKSQDTTVFESMSNDFIMDNISDSGASNETMSTLQDNSMGDFSQPQTPQTETPSEYRLDGMSKSFSDQGFYSPSSTLLDSMLLDDQLQYHAGLLVQSAIQQALAEQAKREGLTEQLEEHEVFGEQEQSTEQLVQSCVPSSPASECQDKAVFERQQSPSAVQKISDCPSKPKTLFFQNFELQEEKNLPNSPVSSFGPQISVEENRQEGGYFSKYSQSAELRSTADVQEPEVTVGPFKLRSRKQRTLSMIEEEIRAAQEREEELKKQRQRLQNPPSPVSKMAPTQQTRTALYKTAPGKIEKIRSPSSPTSDSYPPEVDLLSEDAAGNQKPKNLMETLLEDFESHKTKQRERTDDSSFLSKCLSSRVTSEVIEATRVSRRKSALALRWEAGIYANREDDE